MSPWIDSAEILRLLKESNQFLVQYISLAGNFKLPLLPIVAVGIDGVIVVVFILCRQVVGISAENDDFMLLVLGVVVVDHQTSDSGDRIAHEELQTDELGLFVQFALLVVDDLRYLVAVHLEDLG